MILHHESSAFQFSSNISIKRLSFSKMQHCTIIFKLTLILLTSDSSFGHSCPVLNLTYQNIDDSIIRNKLHVYQYKEIDPVIISPFFGIGDKRCILNFFVGNLNYHCSYVGEQIKTTTFDMSILMLNEIYFKQNLNDNRIQLNYYENTEDIFCGAVAKMSEIWLINHSRCFVSFYGCQMAKVNGKLKRFEGVIILSKSFFFRDTNCSQDELRYTYDVLRKQTGIVLSTLTNNTSIKNLSMARKYCLIERNQLNLCKTFHSHNFDKFINSIFFVILTVGLTIIFVSYLLEKFIGFGYFL